MLSLYVMRHAKSSWKNENLTDFKRPLAKRGKNDLKLIIKFLIKKKIQFDMAYVSSSTRTRETFDILNKKLTIKYKIFSNKLYLTNEDIIFSMIKKTKNKIKKLLIVNHEPVCKLLTSKLIQKKYFSFKFKKFSTSAITKINFNQNNWKSIQSHTGKLIFFKTPRNLA
jgi:phosphohistidine phosphatase